MTAKIFSFSILVFSFVLGSSDTAEANAAMAMASAGAAMGSAKLTGYSANCSHDKWGGKDESASGPKPRSHTLEKSDVVMVAVPQKGGTAHLFKCLFTIDKYPGKMFYGGDRYDDGSKSGINSNGKHKLDISLECSSKVNEFGGQARYRIFRCGVDPKSI